jgi:hypothetical protein
MEASRAWRFGRHFFSSTEISLIKVMNFTTDERTVEAAHENAQRHRQLSDHQI